MIKYGVKWSVYSSNDEYGNVWTLKVVGRTTKENSKVGIIYIGMVKEGIYWMHHNGHDNETCEYVE